VKGLELRNLNRSFGALQAVVDVDLDVGVGEVCGLVGPNGSGKTTLLNVISGVLPPTAGTVRLDERQLSGKPAHYAARSGVSRTFQLIRLVHGATALENVLTGLYLEAPDRNLLTALLPLRSRTARRALVERARDALARLGIAELAGTIVDELPYGLQRRVELARAVVSEPTLLLLDEPAAGITEGDIAQLSALIRAERDRGCAVILVDHHLRFVLDCCARLVVMNFGHKIFDGPSEAAVQDLAVQEAYVGA
jgi:ABC-type branched-subunit amino acid transport system ATPase component